CARSRGNYLYYFAYW
nr:immunoglobulin heavy chain junction region [Mus musculus]MBK4187703.1 immunoglobulin heavy chain junction region [Mus musculus]